ncbi:MAG: hypothetical protein ACTHOP_08010 [Mesorhizobium sp.]
MNTLVQFAGDSLPPRQKPSARTLFLMGMDTVEIAKRLGIDEAVASRRVYMARCREKGLPIETERRQG